jgi:hypothetical protein
MPRFLVTLVLVFLFVAPLSNAQSPSCDFCKRSVAGEFGTHAVALPDGRRLCEHCAATSVTTSARTQDVAGLVASSLDGHGVSVAVEGITFFLVPQDKLDRMSPDPARHTLGFINYAINSQTDDVAHYKITVLNGMPELQLASVLAHQMMHVWLVRAGVRATGTPWIEGSCEYASFLVMSDVNTPESQFVMQNIEANADSICGDGFRTVKQFVAKHGVEGWLDALVPPPAGE